MRDCVAEANVYVVRNAKIVATTSGFAINALLTQDSTPMLGDKYVWIQDEQAPWKATTAGHTNTTSAGKKTCQNGMI